MKNASHFKYLGSELHEQGETDIEIKIRISIGRGTLNSVLWSKNIVTKTKKIFYNTFIQSILNTEIWTVRKIKKGKKEMIRNGDGVLEENSQNIKIRKEN